MDGVDTDYIVGFFVVCAAVLAGIAAENILVFYAVLTGLAAVVIMIAACAEHVCETLSAKQTETNQPVKTKHS